MLLALACLLCVCKALNIEDFGAVHGVQTWEVALKNAEAFVAALESANAGVDRTIVFGSQKTYYMYAVNGSNLMDLHIRIDGTIVYSDEIKRWPDKNFALMYFTDCQDMLISGSGMIDGQGLNWWRMAYTGTDNRPDMIKFQSSRNISISDLYLYSSPKYSVNFVDSADVTVHDITIFVNSSMARGKDKHDSATYALNTDGIDLAVTNALIYNNVITNYDDAIVAKPCKSTGKYCQCSGNIHAFNNTINYSTGLTIGSVPPNADVNCVRNVTFRDSVMHRPLKAIYIKPNPGTVGTGIIENIFYENIVIDHALWWTVWIGPQQQNQPGADGADTGCNFLFPFIPECPTQPLVTMKNIQLRNVIATETLPLFEGPGVILCDAANPCTDFVFYNVTNSVFTGTIEEIYEQLPIFYIPGVIFPTPMRSDDWEFEYITTNVYGKISGDVSPLPCFDANCFFDAGKAQLAAKYGKEKKAMKVEASKSFLRRGD